MAIAAALLCAFLVFGAIIGHLLSNQVLKPRHFDYEQGIEHERTYFNWVEGEFDALEKELFTLSSFDGTALRCIWIGCKEKSDKAVVVAHGHGCCAVNSYKYAKPFLERGYNALLFDFRNSGESGGHITTLGYKERYDLQAAVDEAFLRLGKNAVVGTHGESMGAATALLQACMDDRLSFTVADCPFCDMRAQIAYILKREHSLPRFPFLAFGALSLFFRAGIRMKDVSPLDALKRKDGLPDIPMLFIHGTGDTYILPSSTETLFAAKRGKKRLWLCAGAKHARSIATDPERYRAELNAFLDENNLSPSCKRNEENVQ